MTRPPAPGAGAVALAALRPGKPRVHRSVVQGLALRILRGEFKPGEVLPNEGQLCADLNVSRTSLREAIRVLGAKGLVETKPRTGTRVRPREAWNRLDPDILEWGHGDGLDRDFVDSLIEARRIVEPAAAELAALRATGRDIAAIETALDGMTAALPHDVEGCCRSDLQFHSAILDASHNIVLQQLIGTITAALVHGFRLTNHLMRTQQCALSAHAEVLERIRLRDPAGARAAMLGLLGIALEDLSGVLRLSGRAPGLAMDAAPAEPGPADRGWRGT